MKIVFVASEVVPFAKTGGLADVCGTLPLALEKLGHEVSIIMPCFRGVPVKKIFNERAKVAIIGKNIKVYCLVNKSYFDRANLYGDPTGDYPDNLERFAFFAHETMKLLKDIGVPVDIIHCHDWQTGLIPVLLKENYGADPFFQGTRTVLTIHNLAYQGVFLKEEYAKLGVDEALFNDRQIEFYEKINLLKTGIVFSDYMTTVSPQYAKEIQTKENGCGLEGVIKMRKNKLAGILNGLDYDQWDPEADDFLKPGYSAQDWLAKKIHKARLQDVFKLAPVSDVPIFGFVGRLCYQKGLDLVESAIEGLMQRPIQMAFLGVGEDKYQKMLQKLSRKYPQKFSVLVKYDEDLSHLVYAGSDFFLMPSIYEPCGLTQMIALRYGTIPVASYVGGLVDTVIDLNSSKTRGNGVLMSSYSVSGLDESVDRALGVYSQKDKLNALIAHAMASRFTWEASAKHYVGCYEECLKSA
ncbi:MAG: glycogen synthase GlgA [Candidatus Omnitrophica bacterium]|nr:glycogen synthase GlgA [Candidatus Omnitrophota bacterium]